jgi:Predicted membrane protein
MRAGIRQYLKDSVAELKDCYEPTVPTMDTLKPYAVILQGSDNDNGEVVGFKRDIEIWLYEKRITFKNLDLLSEKVIKALNMQVISDAETNETFTCRFEGTIGQDVIDEEWNAIARGLKFAVIALHEEDEVNTDTWLDALREYTNSITNHIVYLNTWKKDFKVPSILWRVKSQHRERENYALIKESKALICHIASNNKNEINKLLDDIENKLISDLKIPLDLADRRYLTIESINEDREADMLSKGQLTVELFRRKMIENNTPTINNIHGSGVIKGE